MIEPCIGNLKPLLFPRATVVRFTDSFPRYLTIYHHIHIMQFFAKLQELHKKDHSKRKHIALKSGVHSAQECRRASTLLFSVSSLLQVHPLDLHGGHIIRPPLSRSVWHRSEFSSDPDRFYSSMVSDASDSTQTPCIKLEQLDQIRLSRLLKSLGEMTDICKPGPSGEKNRRLCSL